MSGHDGAHDAKKGPRVLRDAVGDCMVSLGERYEKLVVLTSDVDRSSRVVAFKERFPDRSFNTGIAEQSLISVAAGLAEEGLRPMAHAFCPFITMRCFERIRTDVCYPSLPVVLVGNGSGYSNGISGPTHCGLEDAALMALCTNMTVLEASDPGNIEGLLAAAMDLEAPAYVRLTKQAMEDVYPPGTAFEIGHALVPVEGDDGAFICSGVTVHYAMSAARRLREELGANVRVVDMYTLKPLDEEAVLDAARTGRIVAAQDHNLRGGLGEAVAEVLGRNGVSCKMASRGCPEEFVPIATPEFLYARNGMDADGLYEAMRSLL